MTGAALEPADDVIVVADRIHTCSDAGSVGALLVQGGRVAAIGERAALRDAHPHARILDLTGSTLTPGLTDAHAHLTEWAFARREIDLSDTRSPGDAAARLARHPARPPGGAHAYQSGEYAITSSAVTDGSTQPAAGGGVRAGGAVETSWIRGRGWNPHRWDGTPHRSLLDEHAPDRPVALQSHDMHALWVNSAALRVAGIDAGTPDPAGGTIVRDAAGEPTGLLLEWAGRLVTDRIDPPSLDHALAAMRDAQSELHTLGITGAHSLPGIHLTQPDPLSVLSALRDAGQLRLRILQHIALDDLDDAIDAGWRSGEGDEWIRRGAVKMFLDGALGSRTAWMREPYEKSSERGMRTMEPARFRAVVARAAQHGIASTVHAIGDAAVCLALDVLSDPAVRVAAMPHRIEHLQCCPVERLGDAARAGIVCSMQPSHLMTDWSIADRHWGQHRSRGTYAFASLLRHGTILAFGSDVPVEPVDPRLGFAAAVTRQDAAGEPAAGWHPAERVSAATALYGYTVGPALAAGLAAPAGSLAPGAVADFAAWDHDPCTTESLMDMRCTATALAGVLVHAC